MNLSSGVKSASARICATLDRIEECECTTPFGLPSEPDVNSTIAGSSGDWFAALADGNSWCQRIHSLSAGVMRCLRSSR